MRIITFILCICLFHRVSAQQKKFVSIRTLAHFDFAMRVPSLDDAGFGLQLNASLFAKNKLNLLTSAHIEHLLGDKQLILYDDGRVNKTGKIFGIQAGPEYFIIPSISLSAVYGVFWHSIHERTFNADDGYRIALTYLAGKQRKFAMQLARSEVPRTPVKIKYWQFGLGYRFL